jgi:hypothetical protein
MKTTKLTEAQKKAKKAAYDKAYRERKKAQQVLARPEVLEAPAPKKAAPVKKAKPVIETSEFPASTFDRTFDYPIRTYWNLRLEKENSSCAKAGTPLTFEYIHQDQKGVILYRVRRGKRHFYTTSSDLKAPKE